MSVLASHNRVNHPKPLETIVDVGPYRGIVGTMWSITREEGRPQDSLVELSVGPAARRSKRLGEKKGQGVQGLWRGWRVGFWGLVGMWTAAAMSGNSGGGEF